MIEKLIQLLRILDTPPTPSIKRYLITVDAATSGDQVPRVANDWGACMKVLRKAGFQPGLSLRFSSELPRIADSSAYTLRATKHGAELQNLVWATCSLRHSTARHQKNIPSDACPCSCTRSCTALVFSISQIPRHRLGSRVDLQLFQVP